MQILKTCTGCAQSLPHSSFNTRRASRDGLMPRCKACLKADPRRAEYSRKYEAANKEDRRQRWQEYRKRNARACAERTRAWAKRNPVAMRFIKFDWMLRSKYGIDAEDWARLFDAQDCSCAICCRRLDGRLGTHVDHCHRTGRIRGLLCHGCNTSIGHLAESADVLARAAAYLARGAS